MRSLLFKAAQEKTAPFIDLDQSVKDLKLNSAKFNTCLKKEEKSAKIGERGTKEVWDSIQGVPTIFIGKELVLGARPFHNYTDSQGQEVEGLESLVKRQVLQLKK